MSDDLTPLSPTAVERIAYVRGLKSRHLALFKTLATDCGRAFLGVDQMAWAVIDRSIALIDGFCILVEARNALSAIPLLRVQMDNVMRLSACWHVDDPHSVVGHLLKDMPLRKMRSRNKDQMDDAYLHKQLTKRYDWFSRVYERTSGFVHLSGSHIRFPIQEATEDGKMTIAIGNYERRWSDSDIEETIDAFAHTTHALLEFCEGWLVTKKWANDAPNDFASSRQREPSSFPVQ